MTKQPRGSSLLTVAGAMAISVGTYLPWLHTNPDLPPDAKIPTVLFTGMKTGIEGGDFALLGAVGIVLFLGTCSSKQVNWIVTRLMGVGTMLFCVYYLFTSSLIGFNAIFVPALGWYLTVVGALLLTIGGGTKYGGCYSVQPWKLLKN